MLPRFQEETSRYEHDAGADELVEFTLKPGERYGWWADHILEGDHAVALVNGAVNNRRTQIMLDSGASTSILSLDLARRLRLKLKTQSQLRVTGLGGVPTYITAQAEVKITLGVRVVYVLNIWVGNVGDGMECLLGMDFMVAAGVRLWPREGLVKLPDEETILLVGGPELERLGSDVSVSIPETVRLQPGQATRVAIRYGRLDADQVVVWAGRGERWVTQVVYSSQRRPVAIRVVNISSAEVRVTQHTDVARLVETNFLPRGGRFVRPGSRKYREWQQLIYESEPSREFRRREETEAWEAEQAGPPLVEKPTYAWPTKILHRDSRPETSLPAQPGDDEPNRRPESKVPKQTSNPAPSTFTAREQKSVWQGLEETNDVIPGDAGGDVWVMQTADGQTSGGGVTNQEAQSDLARIFPSVQTQVCPEDLSYKMNCAYVLYVQAGVSGRKEDEAVYMHDGSELLIQLRDQLAVLPDLSELSPEANLDKANIGEGGKTTPEMVSRLRAVLERHRSIFLGDGNAVPAPARGVVCDLDVGDARPVAQRSRQVAPHLLPKVFELLKKLLETGLIEYSESEWASPIVIVMKKNGQDIRLCIDYRLVNQLIKLLHYPLPLIDDLLIGFEGAMWFMNLDMASGFWAVPMTQRAKLISAFICPFGHFQWVRMPFGLKNAPLVYQRMLNNCLWGFVRLPPEEEATVDIEVRAFLGIHSESSDASSEEELVVLTDKMTVFQRNIPAPPQMTPVLGRSSYIDDIAHGAENWGQLCEDLDALLYRLRYWGISVSLPKSEFGKLAIPYLSHEICAEGLRATPKIAKGVEDLPFPSTLKGVQSFLGSLNYYNKFIEDLPVIASVLYELTDEQIRQGRDLSRAKEAFEILKKKIVSTPLLCHPVRSKPFVVIIHANPWAACAVLGQEHDGVIRPVRFTGRTLHDPELKYHPAEKEVVALLRVLRVFYTLIVGCHLKVYTRYSVLSWLFKSKTLEGRCLQWAAMLSPWSLEVHRTERDEDGLAAILGAGITPREHLDKVAESLIPAKGRVVPAPPISLEMLEEDYEGYLLSFDGAAKLMDHRGSCGCILWQLPDWKIVAAQGFCLEDVTVNDAEYHGMIHGIRMAMERGIFDLVIVGDSRIAIQQAQGLINCNQPNLQRRLSEFDDLRRQCRSVRLVHVKREFNQAADYVTSKMLASGRSESIDDPLELSHLSQVNRIREKLTKEYEPRIESGPPELESTMERGDSEIDPQIVASAPLPMNARICAVLTRSQTRAGVQNTEAQSTDAQGLELPPSSMGPLEFQAERWRRIRANQDSDPWMKNLKAFLRGELAALSRVEAQNMAKISDQFVLDSREVLYYLSRATPTRPRNAESEPRLAVPISLRPDLLHYVHEDFQGGHQGITRTHERLRREFYWPGMYADVEHFVKECVDCATAKGGPRNPGPSPGNLEPSRPFEVLSMDFVTHLPKSERGNTFLLLFQCTFSGFVLCKPMNSTTAQDVAEAYEECVFRRFGASSLLRHDQDPRFMSEVFTRFRELLGTKQRATLAYRPQANGQQERSVQTVVRSIRAYVAEADQSDWDDHAERLMYALNSSFDSTRLDTPFYLVHGWDARGTISAMLGPPPTAVDQRTAYEWRRKLQRGYAYAQACAHDLQKQAKYERSEAQTQRWKALSDRLKSGFKVGDAVWLYLPRVQPGLSKKLAHLWHGPFRIAEVHDDFRVRLQVEDTGYRVKPWVHISRLKPRALFPTRPSVEVQASEDDDFDAALLPEDSWEPDAQNDEFEVEAIRDVRWTKRTRTSRRIREYLIKWKGYSELQWLPMTQLNCGTLLYEFDKGARAQARFRAMQAGDDHPEPGRH